MKTARVSFCAAAFIAALFAPVSIPRTLADDAADKAALLNQLTTGSWKITFHKGWSIIRVFDKGGAFSTPGRPDETGHWKIAGNSLLQTYDDERKDVLTLPPKAGGMTGTARDGDTMAAVRLDTVPPSPAAFLQTGAEREATIELLGSGPWKITGIGFSNMRVFTRDGSFTTVGNANRNGSWRIAGGVIALTYDDGSKDLLMLPLNAKGTVGADSNGAPSLARLMNTAAPEASPVQSSTASASVTPAPAMDERQKAATVALLVSAPWKFTASGWFAIRVFAGDCTFTTVGSDKAYGVWEISNNMVVLIFQDGHKDTLTLPLNPKGTDGLDHGGNHLTAVLGNPAPGATPPSPSALAYLAPTPAPVAIDEAATTALLLSAPWKFNGGWYSRVRIFASDGTFKTPGHGSESGVWKISDGMLVLTYPDGHNDTVTLPLNPKGTDASGKGGSPVTIMLVTPTPAPTASPADQP